MKLLNHYAIFLSNQSDKNSLIEQLLSKNLSGVLANFNELKGVLFSKISINDILEEEDRHGFTEVTKTLNRSLKSMSSGEQKRVFLHYLLAQKFDFMILDNPFDNLDIATRESLKIMLFEASEKTIFIQLVHRERDLLPFVDTIITIENKYNFVLQPDKQSFLQQYHSQENHFSGEIPPPLRVYENVPEELIKFQNVQVTYNEKPILKDITWTIRKGEFWHLRGPNGSGKTTILSMITGDNPKGYGQNLTLFGIKKGSGESVWTIKENIGYVTPSMTDLFSTRHTLEQMLISGFHDSIGLYVYPTDSQVHTAKSWLKLIGMENLSDKLFYLLSAGQQRMALVVRAMIKHPPLLILDEPIAGLDDYHSLLVVSLINKIAEESNTSILYVSHQDEEGLFPRQVFELIPTENGSVGKNWQTDYTD
jgi:molybdate transport system ATP-binding protein